MGRRIDKLVPVHIRAAALMPAAILTVHQLRFQLAFGAHANQKLATEGHEYLGVLAPAAAMLLAVAVGLFLAKLARAWVDGGERKQPLQQDFSLPKLWAVAAFALLAIYCGQEFFEGLVASGHPGGLAGIFGDGGLWAIPLSVLFAGLVALSLRVADAAVEWASTRKAGSSNRSHSRPTWQRPSGFIALRRPPLADAAAGRAPPLLLPLLNS
jgi:hypothetical protein